MVVDVNDWGSDVINLIISFVGTHAFISVAGVSTRWRHAWGQRSRLTSPKWAVQSFSCLDWARASGLDISNGPCLLAAAEGRLDVLQYAVALGYSREGMRICERAAAGGHLEVVKWCRANGYPWGLSKLLAAEGGHMEMLQWCLANNSPDVSRTTLLGIWSQGPTHVDPEIPKTEVLNAAVKGGHLEIVMWCWQQGYRWDESMCSLAARGGNLKLLKWLRDKGCPWGVWTMIGATVRGDLEILEWCRVNGCPWNITVQAIVTSRGNLEVVQWVFANYPQVGIHNWTCHHATAGGHLEVLQWLRGMGCPWGYHPCFRAACGGHVEVMKWCIANGCPWDDVPGDEMVFEFIGSVSMMVWAAANGCPWMIDPSAMNRLCWHAAKGGNLEVLKWCATNHEMCISSALEQVARNGHVHILEWLRANTGVLDWYIDTGLCSYAASSRSLETVKWCRANGYAWSLDTCAEVAALSGNLELLQWCRVNGCPWGDDTCRRVILSGDFEMLAWCRENGCPPHGRWRESSLSGGYAEMIEWYWESSP